MSHDTFLSKLDCEHVVSAASAVLFRIKKETYHGKMEHQASHGPTYLSVTFFLENILV